MDEKKCIGVKFSDRPSIFNDHYGYPEIDDQKNYNGPTGKAKDIQGPQSHAGSDFLIPNRKAIDFDIDDSQYFIKIRET